MAFAGNKSTAAVPLSGGATAAAGTAASATGLAMAATGAGALAGGGESTAPSKEDLKAEARRLAGPWLHAWHDPVANTKALSNCVRLADLNADGDYKLLIADADKKLKIFRGTSLLSEHALLEVPSALACFYHDTNKPQTPSVAVAAGPYVFIYRNLRPYYKFTLPPVDIDPVETDIWSKAAKATIDATKTNELLTEARDNGVALSSRSAHLLSLKDEKERELWVDSQKGLPLQQLTVVTCMETLNKNLPTERAVSMLVIGTESKHVLILDPTGTTILKKLQLKSVPVFMAVDGMYDVEYRIVVTCRNGNIYTIKKGKVLGAVIELETQPCGVVILEKSILVGCMDNVIHSFHFKGKKNYSIYLPEPITNLTLLHLKRIHAVKALLVALSNGEVRLYNKKSLIATIKSDDVVTAMRFGSYGREDAALILTYKSGALTIKMLQRQAKLDVATTPPGPPPEQDIPLNVPKKTKLYVEQTQRERDQAIDMHRLFQRDLCKLRLSTARSFVKVISDGSGPLSSTGTTPLRLDARVNGLGPFFKIRLTVKNTGVKPCADVPLTFLYNHDIFKLKCNVARIPLLLPGLSYQYEVEVQNIDPNGMADAIRVFVCSPKSSVPTISAIVNMPASELLDKDA